MTNIKEMLAMGREQAVSHLFSIAGGSQGLNIPDEERQKVVAQLRSLADAVENRPETVVGVIVFAGEKVADGINSCAMITGTAPLVAAAHLQLEEHGREALNDCMPALIREALNGFIGSDSVAAPATVQ
jgi:hypothetical protein